MSQSGLQNDAEQPLVSANDNAEKANEMRGKESRGCYYSSSHPHFTGSAHTGVNMCYVEERGHRHQFHIESSLNNNPTFEKKTVTQSSTAQSSSLPT